MKQSGAGFHLRLGYLRWLWFLDRGDAPTNAAIAEAAGHTGQWLTGLIRDGRLPEKAAAQRAVAEFFTVSQAWLFEDGSREDPPRKELWRVWETARRKPRQIPDSAMSPAHGKAAGGKRAAK